MITVRSIIPMLFGITLQVGTALGQGRNFIIALPQNDGYPYQGQSNVEITLATASDRARVYVTYPDGTSKTYLVTNNAVVRLGSADFPKISSFEVLSSQSERALKQAIMVSSDQPITVSVLHAKSVSSDGYLALPIHAWGTSYIVASYYDFKEVFPWPSGFCIMASEDSTKISLLLRGTTDGQATTKMGRRLNTGLTETITLNKGEVFAVFGDATTRSLFDLTGTLIESDKPIGVLGFHARTALPSSLPLEGRDHLIEMLPPVRDWGRSFVSTEYARKFNGTGRGDFFRVIASEDSTFWSVKYFDKITRQLQGQDSGVLQAGHFKDLHQSTTRMILPYGIAVWSASKPIYVMQYSTSANWDGDKINDPFMCGVTPVEHFVRSATSSVSAISSFSTHIVNLIVKVSSKEKALEDLESLLVNGESLISHSNLVNGPVINNGVPGRDGLYYCSLSLGTQSQPLRITGNGRVTFGGAVYGFGDMDSYGWPLPSIEPVSNDTVLSMREAIDHPVLLANYTDGVLFVHLPASLVTATPCRLELFDLAGRSIVNTTVTPSSTPLRLVIPTLARGTYLLTMTPDSGAPVTGRMIVE